MKVFNKIKDALNSADFEVDAGMKLAELKKNFMKSFDLTLRVYVGKKLASDGRMTIKSLDNRLNKNKVDFDAGKKTIRASMKVKEVEKLFLDHFGLTVQIADKADKKLVSDSLSLGDASRSN